MRIERRLSKTEQRAIEDGFKNQHEAFELLGLIDAEFRSDPTSVQCFDARMVERVRYCVALRKHCEEARGYF